MGWKGRVCYLGRFVNAQKDPSQDRTRVKAVATSVSVRESANIPTA